MAVSYLSHFVCARCGPHVTVREGGSCVHCGEPTVIKSCFCERLIALNQVRAIVHLRVLDWAGTTSSARDELTNIQGEIDALIEETEKEAEENDAEFYPT